MIKPTHKASGKLFAEPETPSARQEGAYTANIDGAARGNPGPAAYGVVVRRPDGTTHESLGKYIGRTTNNVAEYYALIAALDYAAASGIKRLRVYSDSQLIVNQIKGLYKVKHPDLRPLHERAKKQAASLEAFTIQYVPREQNRDADDLANAALDSTSGVKPAYGAAPAKVVSPAKVLYLEDLHVGQKFSSGTYRMDEDRIKSFAAEFDPQPFHLDDAAARSTASFAGSPRAAGIRRRRRCGFWSPVDCRSPAGLSAWAAKSRGPGRRVPATRCGWKARSSRSCLHDPNPIRLLLRCGTLPSIKKANKCRS